MTPEQMKAYGKGLGLWKDRTPQEPAPVTEFRDVPVYLNEPKPVSQEIPGTR